MRKVICALCSLALFSCNVTTTEQKEEEKDPPAVPSVWPINYQGGGTNGFIMSIVINEDMSTLVQSGCPRTMDGKIIEGTEDTENLVCSMTDSGFVLLDPTSKTVLYTAIIKEGTIREEKSSLPWSATISWSHSPGLCWDTYAEERGWKKEISIHIWAVD